MKIIKALVVLAVVAAGLAVAFVYSGAYNIAADEPHWPLTSKLIETLRERSIGSRAGNVQVPALDAPQRVAEGAQHYAAMCTACHLAPGMEDTEIRQGLSPQPPRLFEQAGENPAQQFWVIKHGLKMTGMPSWGATHDDASIWAIVAFLQKLPGLSPEDYAAAVAASEGSHAGSAHHEHGDSHEHEDGHEHAH